ncbi:MAG TPA: hypothetical protein VHX67_03450 [Acidimicrobiales bacterium]|nr:hypothetical protein [Acidimicrobiales bacterium]
MPALRVASRCDAERGAALGAFVATARRGRGLVCRSGGAMLRVDVIAPTPSGRGRATLLGPTPDACMQSPPPRG